MSNIRKALGAVVKEALEKEVDYNVEDIVNSISKDVKEFDDGEFKGFEVTIENTPINQSLILNKKFRDILHSEVIGDIEGANRYSYKIDIHKGEIKIYFIFAKVYDKRIYIHDLDVTSVMYKSMRANSQVRIDRLSIGKFIVEYALHNKLYNTIKIDKTIVLSIPIKVLFKDNCTLNYTTKFTENLAHSLKVILNDVTFDVDDDLDNGKIDISGDYSMKMNVDTYQTEIHESYISLTININDVSNKEKRKIKK